MDQRIKWIGEKTLTFLGLENFDLFNNMLDSNDGDIRERMNNFICAEVQGVEENYEKVMFYVHRAYYDKLVEIEKEVTEWRVVQPVVKLTTPPPSSKKKGKDKDRDKQKQAKNKSDKKPAKEKSKDKKGTEPSVDEPDTIVDDTESGDNPQNEDDSLSKSVNGKKSVEDSAIMHSKPPDPDVEGTIEYYTLKRLVPVMMKLPKFNGKFGQMDISNAETTVKFVHFIRICESPIPLPSNENEIDFIMPSCFIIGSCEYNFTKSLYKILKHCYINLIGHETNEEISSNGEINGKKIEVIEEAFLKNVMIDYPEKTYHRPSYFYRKSIYLKKKNIEQAVDEISVSENNKEQTSKLYSYASYQTLKDDPDASLDASSDLNLLIKSLEWLIDYNEKEMQFIIPNVPDLEGDNFLEKVTQNKDIVKILETSAKNWCNVISSKMDQSDIKTQGAEGPLTEYEFWKSQYVITLRLKEQLLDPSIQKIILSLKTIDSPLSRKLDEKIDKLFKNYEISKENLKLLTTLLKYFEVITKSSEFKLVTDSIPGLIYGLSILWMLSKYYSNDEHMVPLFESIANCLCKKIETYLAVENLFSNSYANVYKLSCDGNVMLKKWRDSYTNIQDKIEKLGKNARWEFDKRRLFYHTDYLANVCKDLANIAQVLLEFENILSAELKAIVKDQEKVEVFAKDVHQLIYPIKTIDFSVFIPDNKENWDVIMNDFHREVNDLEVRTKTFIDESFNGLSSSEETCKMLALFTRFKTRDSIHQTLKNKLGHVWKRYLDEIEMINSLFEANQSNPPLLQNHPPVSGSIFWSRFLYQKLNKSLQMFERVSELEASDQKLLVLAKYQEMCNRLKNYEEEKYNEWLKTSIPIITSNMNNNLLKVVTKGSKQKINYNFLKVSNVLSSLITVRGIDIRKRSSVVKPIKRSSQDHHLLTDENLQHMVNLDQKLFEIIEEIEMMDTFGLKLPLNVKHCAMQRDRLYNEFKMLDIIVLEYNSLLKKLSPFEKKIMRHHLYKVELKLFPGLKRISWSSLIVADFIDDCKKEVENLKSKYKEFVVINEEVESILQKFTQFSFFPIIFPKCEHVSENRKQLIKLYSYEQFFSQIERARSNDIVTMKKHYETIGHIIMKLEYIILGTQSGTSNVMLDVYNHWETQILQTFIKLCVDNIESFNNVLNNNCVFQVDALIENSEVTISPSLQEIHDILVHNLNDFLERFKNFPRWISKTCILEKTKYIEADDILQVNSFYDDVKQESKIKNNISILLKTINDNAANVYSYVKKWSKFKSLLSDKQSSCEKYTQRHTEIEKFDDRFSFFENIIDELEGHVKYVNIGCIRVNLDPIISQIQSHALEWKKTLGTCLITLVKERMKELSDIILKLHMNLHKNIKNLNDFKLVMLTITKIKEITINVEVVYRSVQEYFYTLINHNIDVSKDDIQFSQLLETKWKDLYISSLFRFDKLHKIKENFSKSTLNNIEEFSLVLSKFIEKFNSEGPATVGDDLEKGLILMEEYEKTFDDLESQKIVLCNAEQLFDNPLYDYSDYYRTKENYNNLKLIYKIYIDLKSKKNASSKILWKDFEPNDLIVYGDDIKNKFRMLEEPIRDVTCAIALNKKIDAFKNVTLLMKALKNEAINDRHWEQIMKETGKTFDISDDVFILESIFSLDLNNYQIIIETIIGCAIKELSIENDINDIQNVWKDMKLNIIKYTKDEEHRGYKLISCDELIMLVEDHCLQLQRMAASRYIGPFAAIVQKYNTNLTTISEVIDMWLNVQQKWIYLEGIFLNSEIKIQLPEESKKFVNVNAVYKKIMEETYKISLVTACCLAPNKLKILLKISSQLDECQKTLFNHLNSKRRIFPRFYFISFDELLSILGSSDPCCIQEHINKMFENLQELKIIKDSQKYVASGFVSSENEILEFQRGINLEGNVENWMNSIVQEMKASNKILTKKCIYEYGRNKHVSRIDWILENLGMVSLAANAVWWTAETEEAFFKLNNGDVKAMKNFLVKINKQLEELVSKVRNELSPNDLKKLKTMITVDVHSRDMIENFVLNQITDSKEFEWESQLRFYWVKINDNLQIEQCSGIFDYGYEYIGLNGRLVITPLTDRIYLTITQALTMYLGCAPSGPAGTGKTETVKDLAKSFALLCIITNCAENMNFHNISQVLAGLCQCGAWGCFDDFNHINITVLSVISTQIQNIRNALTADSSNFNLNSSNIQLTKSVAIFITMDPGYESHTKLPESLKALFRPIMCVVPDFEIICQISLYSDGFLQAKTLAKKITILYKLAQGQLSKQPHYDWGLRSLVALIHMLTNLKKHATKDSEQQILIKALCNVNFPKFIKDDTPLFLNLIKDIFPDAEYSNIKNPSFSSSIEHVALNNQYIIVPYQTDKVVQLRNIMNSQHSVMLIGPTGGGKSTIIQLFIEAQNHIGIITKSSIINPKAITINELYGVQNLLTGDWTDGLFSSIFRKINRNLENTIKHLILFDGDVDPQWIENMNSVMDDNKLLTLANGERIRLSQHCILLFEVGDLIYASPATTSRAGMIFVDPKNFGYIPYWSRWLNTKTSNDEKFLLKSLFDVYVPKVVQRTFEGIKEEEAFKLVIQTSPLNLVTQLCFMMDALTQIKNESNEMCNQDTLFCIFIISLYYSFGVVIAQENLQEFDAFIKQCGQISLFEDNINQKATTKFLPKSFPTLFDYYLNVKENCWEAWEWLIPKYVHNKSKIFSNTFIHTSDTMRAEWIIKLMESVNRPVLMVGNTGTAKTSVITNYMNNLNNELYVVSKISFSFYTTSMDFQQNLEASLEKRTKNIYGPSIGKKLIFFIDDMNIPQVDEFGTQTPIALLKHIFEYNGFYNRKDNSAWKIIKDVYFIGAMATSRGRNKVDSRFTSKFSIYNMAFPTDNMLNHIYLTILQSHFESFSMDIREIAPKLVQMTLDLFKTLSIELMPTPSKFHYTFNLRDLSHIMLGLCLAQPNLYPEPKYIIRLWRNEMCRVICDRFINSEDQILLQDHIISAVNKYFAEDTSSDKETQQNIAERESDIVKTSGGTEETSEEGLDEESYHDKPKELTIEEYILREPLLFGDFRNALNNEERFYEDLLDYDAVYYLFQEILEEYNDQISTMSLILFEDCLEHLTRVHRILRMRHNHMLFIGSGSSGKKSIIKLASFAAGAEIFEIKCFHGYNETMFREDLKTLFRSIGLEDKNVVFLITASQIVEESFLDLINIILIDGMTFALFNDEEKDAIINSVRDKALDSGYSSDRNSVWKYFSNTCADKLHVVFVTPPGDLLRTRCNNFPALMNNMTINWLFPWPKQALLAVANIFLTDVAYLPEQYREVVIQHMIYVHESANNYTVDYNNKLKRYYYITPGHYINFIKNYLELIESKEKYITEQCKRLEDGVTKTEDVNIEIEKLNSELMMQNSILNEQLNDYEQIIKNIAGANEKNEMKQKVITEKDTEILELRKLIEINKNEAESASLQATSVLNIARMSLEGLDQKDITEIRSFASPPEDIQIICESVLMIWGSTEINWKNAKEMMTDPNFPRKLVDMNYEVIMQQQIETIEAHLKKIKKMDEIQNVSNAGYNMLKFLKNVIDYCAALSAVKPIRDKIESLEHQQHEEENQLEVLKKEIEKISNELSILHEKYEETIKRKEELQNIIAIMSKKLKTAERLLSGFASEKIRWKEELKLLHDEKPKIVGNCLLSAAFLNYLGPFTYEYRNKIMYEDWLNDIIQKNIPVLTPYKVEMTLTNNVEISEWSSEGLPPDEYSTQNGILTIHTNRYPLCIDPQEQAINWIKCKEENNSLKIITLDDLDYLNQIELAIKSGLPVLIQDITEYINPLLNQIINKEIKVELGHQYIILKNKHIEYNPNFRLYLSTRLTNPNFDPNIYTKTTVINYLITPKCLEEQLLLTVVHNESPELDDQRKQLIKENYLNKNLLKQYEDEILKELSIMTSSILDNEDLILTLENAKIKSSEISEKLDKVSEMKAQIDTYCEIQRPIAERGSMLFFTLLSMSTVNEMYQYSISSYIELFTLSCNQIQTGEDVNQKITNIINTLTFNVYEYGCIGIFEQHKLLLSFIITTNLERSNGNITQKHIDFFIKGTTLSEKTENNKSVPWLEEDSWESICDLSVSFPDVFSNLNDTISEDSEKWEEWHNSNEPELRDMPNKYIEKLSPFEKLMLIRCFRIDRVYCAMSNYINTVMGEEYTTFPTISLETIYEKTTSSTWVIFMISSGLNLLNHLMELADKYGFLEKKFTYISLGQGQELITKNLLEMAMRDGHWLVLQNCHLLPKFMLEIEKNLIKQINNAHHDFRLWLTTEPISTFPLGILQKGIKVVTEPPKGLKQNLKSTYIQMTDDTLNKCMHPVFKKLVYVLSFFHAIVQERRKYNKIGWNICYDFNDSDFTICIQLLDHYLEKIYMNNKSIPWTTIKFLFGEIMYGGHVIDSFDRRTLKTYIDEYFGDFILDIYQPFYFYQNDLVKYAVPEDGTKEHYIKYINELPSLNTPEILGLNSNAEIGYYTKSIKNIWNYLSNMYSNKDVLTITSKDSIVAKITKDILNKIPREFNLSNIKKQFEMNITPTSTVLLQELERFNALSRTMLDTLDLLLKAQSGEFNMNSMLEDIADSLYNGCLPIIWRKLAPQTCKTLASWIDHFVKRSEQYESWATKEEPIVVWLSGLHIPESLLIAHLQTVSHRNAWQLENCSQQTKVTTFTNVDDVEERPSVGCYIHGLYLEGARWDEKNQCLKKSHPKVLVTELPIVHIIPVERAKINIENYLITPVYVTSQRRNEMGTGLVLEAQLRTTIDISRWILQGVCIIMNTD